MISTVGLLLALAHPSLFGKHRAAPSVTPGNHGVLPVLRVLGEENHCVSPRSGIALWPPLPAHVGQAQKGAGSEGARGPVWLRVRQHVGGWGAWPRSRAAAQPSQRKAPVRAPGRSGGRASAARSLVGVTAARLAVTRPHCLVRFSATSASGSVTYFRRLAGRCKGRLEASRPRRHLPCPSIPPPGDAGSGKPGVCRAAQRPTPSPSTSRGGGRSLLSPPTPLFCRVPAVAPFCP